MGFRGFPDAAFQFYEQLMADNSRTFWQANLPTYRSSVRAPMDALLAELADHGPFHVFRPNRDVRFSKDKRPYKEAIGAVSESEGGASFYVQLSASGMVAGSGYYHMAADQLDRFRRALDADATGSDLVSICESVERAGLRLGAIDELKTAPRGYAKDHPRIGFLRRKGLVATKEWPEAKWMRTAAVVTRVRDAWNAGREMNEWLDAHVGPSTLAPDERELERAARR
jgi:uncharacterized protein (TIGR02453 family)